MPDNDSKPQKFRKKKGSPFRKEFGLQSSSLRDAQKKNEYILEIIPPNVLD